MKKQKEFILHLINKMSLKYPLCRFSYKGFKWNTHSINVLPKELYESDEFIEFESEIILEFIKKYPKVGINFICE